MCFWTVPAEVKPALRRPPLIPASVFGQWLPHAQSGGHSACTSSWSELYYELTPSHPPRPPFGSAPRSPLVSPTAPLHPTCSRLQARPPSLPTRGLAPSFMETARHAVGLPLPFSPSEQGPSSPTPPPSTAGRRPGGGPRLDLPSAAFQRARSLSRLLFHKTRILQKEYTNAKRLLT